ncbi:pin domain protein [hydrocarbon metagenome]|uniref:Pin domain protein n=1 Tax=hydrocarbon metagenome TaxID=938273 RepID=A0A0W8FX65_9ZZZZ
MTEKFFIDTNILIYTIDNHYPKKKIISRELIAKLFEDASGIISTQVLQEFYYTAVNKLNSDPKIIKALLKSFEDLEIVQINTTIIHNAIDCSITNKISFWDALIITAAESANCNKLFSEDLNNGQVINGVEIVNPFI